MFFSQCSISMYWLSNNIYIYYSVYYSVSKRANLHCRYNEQIAKTFTSKFCWSQTGAKHKFLKTPFFWSTCWLLIIHFESKLCASDLTLMLSNPTASSTNASKTRQVLTCSKTVISGDIFERFSGMQVRLPWYIAKQ